MKLRINSSNKYRRINRQAFTLVETLLALALSSALIVAVFSLIGSTVSYQVTGTDQVLVSQRLIGLLQDLRLDIHSVQLDPQWQTVPVIEPDMQSTMDDLRAIAGPRLTSQLQLSDMDKFAEPIRLAGENHWLMLTLGQANPRWPQDSNYDQQVVWSLGGRGAITVPTHDDHGRWTTKVIPGSSGAGLTRTRLVGSDRVESDLVIAADSLRFRYLNGQRWQATWNSSSEKRLPDAIEITLGITADAELRTWVIQTSTLNGQVGGTK